MAVLHVQSTLDVWDRGAGRGTTIQYRDVIRYMCHRCDCNSCRLSVVCRTQVHVRWSSESLRKRKSIDRDMNRTAHNLERSEMRYQVKCADVTYRV